MKRKTTIFNAILIFFGLFAILILGINNTKENRLLLRGEPEPYAITLNSTTNKLVVSSEFVSGVATLKTGLNNSISFNYTNLKDDVNVWQIIKVGGSLENIEPISGITSLSITKENTNAHLGVYWSDVHLFDEEHFVEFETSSNLEVSTSFNGEHPNYFKVVALGLDDASISSINVEYSCEYDLPETLEIGMYPQTKVVDSSLINELNLKAGDLPTPENNQNWTSYNYYISENITDFMWYQDVAIGNELYRGVYFDQYRPSNTTKSSSTGNSYQDDNGYTINSRYWFKYEPIVWDVLSVNEEEGPLLLSSKILDSQDYYHLNNNRTIDKKTIYPNNYKESNIRAFLNNNFYNTAFSSEEESLIATTNVDNSAYSSGNTTNNYACENTNDKLFLPSRIEVTNTTYGFDTDASRIKQSSDYAKAMGIRIYSSVYSYWWQRSPNSSLSGRAHCVTYKGELDSGVVYWAEIGVLPALRIKR